MKSLLILPLMMLACGQPNLPTGLTAPTYAQLVTNAPPDTLLAGVQQRIYNTFVAGMMSGDGTALAELDDRLAGLATGGSSNLPTYWRAYLQYYTAIFHLKRDDPKVAEAACDLGVELLEELSQKNSEDYALLAMLQGFGMQFKGMRAMFLAGKVKENAQRAVALDSTNLRAHYVCGSNDFYTPAKYGGGQAAEGYLRQAVRLPSQRVPNPYLPSWGKEEAYELLVRHYIRQEDWAQAKTSFQQGIADYPESYQLNQLAAQLVGK